MYLITYFLICQLLWWIGIKMLGFEGDRLPLILFIGLTWPIIIGLVVLYSILYIFSVLVFKTLESLNDLLFKLFPKQ